MDLAEDDRGSKSALKLWLRMGHSKKLHGKYKDHNAIEFLFELYTDVPEEVAQEMVGVLLCRRHHHAVSATCLLWQVVLGFLSEADYKLVAKAIRHRVTAIKHHREKQQHLKDGGADHTPTTTRPACPDPAPSTGAPAAEIVTYRVSEMVLMDGWIKLLMYQPITSGPGSTQATPTASGTLSVASSLSSPVDSGISNTSRRMDANEDDSVSKTRSRAKGHDPTMCHH